MRRSLSVGPRGLLPFAFLALALAAAVLRAADALPAVAKPNVNAPVTLTDGGSTWTMDNGIVKAAINKGNCHMTAVTYHGINTMGPGGDGHNRLPARGR